MMLPRFKVFDVVEIGDHPALVAAELTGRRGVVVQIREYAGPRYRYSVRSLIDDDDDGAGLYDEENLIATSEEAPADLFTLPGGFLRREIVKVSMAYHDPTIAGQTGTVDGTYTDEGGLGIWIEPLRESFIVESSFLSRTGRRRLFPATKRLATSTLVNVNGDVTGTSSYVVIDDTDRLL